MHELHVCVRFGISWHTPITLPFLRQYSLLLEYDLSREYLQKKKPYGKGNLPMQGNTAQTIIRAPAGAIDGYKQHQIDANYW